MQLFLLGMISMGSAVAALLFLRFWKNSRDRLFLLFALAFGLEAVNRALYAYNGVRNEDEPLYFGLRLVSYLLILYAILDKNVFQKRRERAR
ncbi:DUF5985 family protein [Vulcaniibacterium thermophilum]|jgi:hypothetical protein|uniref:Uncharacterized protein n=1 Tax=Vulcaniibacterium thermophilum TaxID=1169913 RepID=A0A918ZA91_9GAMM|nr:DUF5985 family protein [Vulcaniibacterium thermophilum]GHE42044.1 hypothetical protein GCM10007167_24870 [Vulcaniibacterium thermophilum]